MRKPFKGIELSKIVFIGRTFDEYVRMFNLSEEEIKEQRILDAPAGACSFTAVAHSKGSIVTAADIAYFHPIDELYNKGINDIEQAAEGLSLVQDQYIWSYFQNMDALEKHRREAVQVCINHMGKYPDCYVPCQLPNLPFENEGFDMTLSAHFLFTYADRLDLEFHKQTIRELLRVTKTEVRIFPLVDLKSTKFTELDTIKEFIHNMGWNAEEQVVDYEFQKNANSMLRIYKK